MAIRITPVRSKRDLTDFVNLPYALHGSSRFWVPPLKKLDRALLSPGRHPFWATARRELFSAYSENRIIGRIAAIVDDKYNSYSSENAGAFGFFECENNQAATAALLERAAEWLISEGCAFMRGPLNPSLNYTCGVLVGGFDYAPAFMMPWNPEYYPRLLESCGLRKEQDLFAYVIERRRLELPATLQEEAERLKASGRFTFRAASRATMAADIRALLTIYAAAWADNWGFSPLSQAEADNHVHDLEDIVDPDFFVLFFDREKPVAGMLALPDINPLLKRLKGRIGIAAPFHYWRSRAAIRSGMRIMLFGILPEYRLQGLPLLLLDYILARARQRPDLEWVEGSWILEDNLAMNELMEDFSGQLLKRYRIYRKEIGVC